MNNYPCIKQSIHYAYLVLFTAPSTGYYIGGGLEDDRRFGEHRNSWGENHFCTFNDIDKVSSLLKKAYYKYGKTNFELDLVMTKLDKSL